MIKGQPEVSMPPINAPEPGPAESNRSLMIEVEQLREKEISLQRLLMATSLLVRTPGLTTGDRAASLKEITQLSACSLGVQRASIWLFDQERSAIQCACLYDGLQDAHAQGSILEATDFPNYFDEIQRGRVISAEDAEQDPRTAEFREPYLRPLGIRAVLDVPIKHEDRLAGVVCHEHTGGTRAWAREEQQFAAFVSSLVSLVLLRG